jgi:hypothetical protein
MAAREIAGICFWGGVLEGVAEVIGVGRMGVDVSRRDRWGLLVGREGRGGIRLENRPGEVAEGQDREVDAEGPVGREDEEADDGGDREGEGLRNGAGLHGFADDEKSGSERDENGDIFQQGAEREIDADGFGAAGFEGSDQDEEGADHDEDAEDDLLPEFHDGKGSRRMRGGKGVASKLLLGWRR